MIKSENPVLTMAASHFFEQVFTVFFFLSHCSYLLLIIISIHLFIHIY
jgi:hypothetical protein